MSQLRLSVFLITHLLLTAAAQAAVDCSKVMPAASLASKLACTPNHFGVRLGTFLRPVAEQIPLSGLVIFSGDGIEPPLAGERCIPFTYDEFTNPDYSCIGHCADGDFTFFLQLDQQSKDRLADLRALDPWRALLITGIVHVEVIAYGRNIADRNLPLFPGWADKLRSVVANGKPLNKAYSCAAEASCVCTEPRVDGSDLRGATVTVEGALVVDCNDPACETGSKFLEIHPAYAITFHAQVH